jgi:hypothetical protein
MREPLETELAKILEALRRHDPPLELHPVADGKGNWHYEIRQGKRENANA